MTMNQLPRLRQLVGVAVSVATLTACGGGGGDGDSPFVSRGTVALTTANRDTAARALATSIMALGASTAIPFAGEGGASALRAVAPTPFGAARLGMASWLPARVLDAFREAVVSPRQPAHGGTVRPLAVVVSAPVSCLVGGTVTVTIDDRDNNNQLSAGDVWSFDFRQCQDTPSGILSGVVAISFTSIVATTLPAFSARMSFVQLSQEAVDGRHGLSITGTVTLDYAQNSSTAERLKLTADGNVLAAVHTHLPFTDNLTLQSGFFQDASYDSGTGLTRTTMAGMVRSQALGGTVAASTPALIVASDTDRYPRSGVLDALGSTGRVRLSIVSNSQVRTELDADDNGSFESSNTQAWDTLI